MMAMIGDVECNKRCYTEREANEVLNIVHGSHQRKGRKKKVPKRKYYCEECAAWHLTSWSYYEQKKRSGRR